MKTKNLFLTGLFFLYSFYIFAQRNPSQEILVFFSTGVSQEIVVKQGKTLKTTKIRDVKLKSSLKKIGIDESMLEAAIPDFSKKDTHKVLPDGSRLYQADMSKLYRIRMPDRQNRNEIIKQLNSLPEVLYAEANGSVSPDVIPSDTHFQQQWGLKNNLHPGKDIHAEGAWNIYTGNSHNIIAIIDGGTNKNHPDLNDKIAGGDNGYGWGGHGIHVSGIAAAESNNNQGVSGVDWHARIHAQRIDNVSDDVATYQAIVDAVNYSNKVYVLNNSWGLTDNGNPGRYSTTVKLAYVYAYNANRTMVSAMGNHNDTYPGVPNYPAGFGIGIAVGATDNNDNIANFSVRGNYIDVSAPGVGIYSTLNSSYGNMSGTSMATPFVSGIASLLKGYKPNLSNDDIENIIRLSADEVTGMNGNNYTTTYGYGRVNAEQALKYLQSPYNLYQWTTSEGSVVNSTGQYTHVFIGAHGLASGTYIVKRHEVRKTVSYPQSFYSLVGVWGRGVSTNGWNRSNPNLGKKFCEVVSGTASTTGATLRTYVYQVWSVSGQYLGYYPASPSNVQFAYTAIGIKAPSIYGPVTVCTSNSTFTLQNRPSGSSVTWTKSSNLTYVSGQGTNNYTVKATGNGNGWVQANVNGVVLKKNVWVGLKATLSGNSSVLYLKTGTWKATASCGYFPYNYDWFLRKEGPGMGAVMLEYEHNSTLTLKSVKEGTKTYFNNNINNTETKQPHDYRIFYLYARVSDQSNIYNTSEERIVAYGKVDLVPAFSIYKNSKNEQNIQVFPNPAKDILTIEIEQDKMSKEIQTKEVEIRLYDKLMIMRKHKVFKGNLIRLNLNDLKPDVYILQLKIGDEIFEEKIMHSY